MNRKLPCLSFLSAFDMFKINMFVFFNSKSKRSTWLGVILSLSLFSILITNLIQSDFIQKRSPYVLVEDKVIPHAEKITYDQFHFISISVSDNDNVNLIDNSIFQIEFNTYKYQINDKQQYQIKSKETKSLQNCNETNMKSNSYLFKEFGLKNAKCLEDPNFFVEGYWDEPEVYYAEARLLLCNNKTSNNTCKSYKEMEDFFQDGKYFQIVGYGINVQFNNYDNPMKKQYEIVYQLLDFNLYKEKNVRLKNLELTTEEGLFFSSKRSQTDFLIHSSDVDYSLRENDNDLAATIILYSSHYKTHNYRRYQTISELLASLSGTANFFMFFFFIFTNMKNYIQTMTKILNKLYSYPEHVTKNKKNSKTSRKSVSKEISNKNFFKNNLASLSEKKEENIEIKSLDCSKEKINPKIFAKFVKEDSFILPHYSQEEIHEKQEISVHSNKRTINFLKKTFSNLPFPNFTWRKSTNLIDQKQNEGKFYVSILEYLKYKLKKFLKCKKTRKEVWIEKSEKVLRSDLDIIEILSKLKELEKLKLILFNEDQLILFESLTKPMLYFEKDQVYQKYEFQSSIKLRKILNQYRKTEIDQIKFLKALNNIKNDQKSKINPNDFNSRLLNLIE